MASAALFEAELPVLRSTLTKLDDVTVTLLGRRGMIFAGLSFVVVDIVSVADAVAADGVDAGVNVVEGADMSEEGFSEEGFGCCCCCCEGSGGAVTDCRSSPTLLPPTRPKPGWLEFGPCPEEIELLLLPLFLGVSETLRSTLDLSRVTLHVEVLRGAGLAGRAVLL